MNAIRIFVLLFALTCAADAQVPMTGAGLPVPIASAPPYTGPGDVVSGAFAWHGLRAYNSATRGAALVNVCNSTGGVDVACADMVSDATTGALVPATIGLITCPGTNCTIKTWYDQGSTGTNITQAVVANRAALTASCLGSLPCATFTAANSENYQSSGTISQAQPWTIIQVTNRVSGTSGQAGLMTNGSAGQGNVPFGFLYAFVPNYNTVYDSGDGSFLNGSANDNSVNIFIGLISGASSVLYTNNVATTGSSVTTAAGGTIAIGSVFSSFYLDGTFFEGGMWPGGFNATQAGNMCHNLYAYWGTAVSC